MLTSFARKTNSKTLYQASKSFSTIIGIDLGTTNSCVAVMEGNNARVIENAEGTSFDIYSNHVPLQAKEPLLPSWLSLITTKDLWVCQPRDR